MSPRVLFVGDGWTGSNAVSLANGFRGAGAETVHVDTTHVSRPPRYSRPWVYSKLRGSRRPTDVEAVHRQVELACEALRPDVMVCFKTIHLDQERLLNTPVPMKIHYSADDVSNPYNTTQSYLNLESEWDVIVTTKVHNLQELRARGVKRAEFVWSAFDPAWHFPAARLSPTRHALGFVGNLRPDRAELMRMMARKMGGQLLICGPGWKSDKQLGTTEAVVEGAKYGADFSAAVARTSGQLVLLNSENRDRHTCRSFEVPAAGGLFVGERTDEHQEILDDGTQALMFSSHAELEEVVSRVIKGGAEIERMALDGHRRVVSEGHTYVDRAREILSVASKARDDAL